MSRASADLGKALGALLDALIAQPTDERLSKGILHWLAWRSRWQPN
jgi:hypothetical protein